MACSAENMVHQPARPEGLGTPQKPFSQEPVTISIQARDDFAFTADLVQENA
jgi:hypothetical protein